MMKGKSSREIREAELDEIRRKKIITEWHKQNKIDPNAALNVKTIEEWQYEMRHRDQELRKQHKSAEEYLHKYSGKGMAIQGGGGKKKSNPSSPHPPLEGKHVMNVDPAVSMEKLKDKFNNSPFPDEVIQANQSPQQEYALHPDYDVDTFLNKQDETPEIKPPSNEITCTDLNITFCFRLLTRHKIQPNEDTSELLLPYMLNAHLAIESACFSYQDTISCPSLPICSSIQSDPSTTNDNCYCYIVFSSVALQINSNCPLNTSNIQEMVLDSLKMAVTDGSFGRIRTS